MSQNLERDSSLRNFHTPCLSLRSGSIAKSRRSSGVRRNWHQHLQQEATSVYQTSCWSEFIVWQALITFLPRGTDSLCWIEPYCHWWRCYMWQFFGINKQSVECDTQSGQIITYFRMLNHASENVMIANRALEATTLLHSILVTSRELICTLVSITENSLNSMTVLMQCQWKCPGHKWFSTMPRGIGMTFSSKKVQI